MDELKKLYEAVSPKVNVGSFEDFSSKMGDADSRKRFYEAVKTKGVNLGDYGAYEQRLGTGGTEKTPYKSILQTTPNEVAKPAKTVEQVKKQNADGSSGSPSASASIDSLLGFEPKTSPAFGGKPDPKAEPLIKPKSQPATYAERLDGMPDRGLAVRDKASKMIRKQYEDQGIKEYRITPQQIDEQASKMLDKEKAVKAADTLNKINSTKSTKEQRGYWSHFLEDKLAISSTKLGEMVAGIPESLYDIASIPQNAFSALTGIDVTTSSAKFKKNTGLSNPVLDLYMDETAKLQERSEKYDEKYIHKGAFASFQNGKIMDGFEQLGSGIAESSAVSIAMMAGGTALTMGKLAATTTTAMYGEKMREVQSDNPKMNEFETNVKALGLAGAETVFSAVSSKALGDVYKDILLKEGQQVGAEVFKKGVMEMYKTALKKYGGLADALGEGIEEVATTITQNLINGKPALEGVAESFLQGAGGGVVYGAPINAMNIANKFKEGHNNRQIEKVIEADTNEYTTITDAFVPNFSGVTPVDKIALVQKKGALNKLTKELDKSVAEGTMSEEDATAHKKEFLDTNLALSKTNGFGFDETSTAKAVDLLRKKEGLLAEIKNMDDALATPKKEELVAINEQLITMAEKAMADNKAAQEAKNPSKKVEEVVKPKKVGKDVEAEIADGDRFYTENLKSDKPSEVEAAKKYFDNKLDYNRRLLSMYQEDVAANPEDTFAKGKVELLKKVVNELKTPAEMKDVKEATPEDYSIAMSEALTSMGESDNKVNLQVDPVSLEDAKQIVADGGKLFMTKDGKSGAYVKADGYMGGLFKNPSSDLKEVGKVLQQARTEAGGTHFDAFGTKLEDIYIKNGFVPVARIPFDEAYAPEGWDAPDSPLKDKPDNVFFAYNPDAKAKKGDGEMVDSYEAGIAMAKNSTARDGKQNTEFFTGKAKEASSKIPYKPVIEVDQTTPVAQAYQKFSSEGNFTGHISKMIAGFAEKQKQVAEAIVKGGFKRFLDIGTSEGGMIKTVASQNPNMKAVGIDPNTQMKENFNATEDVPNAEFRQEAWQASWKDDDGTVINEFKPDEKFDVVNEDFAFQFMNNNREQQVQGVKAAMTPDGIFVTSEKFHTDNQAANEQKKYDHQKNYFDESQLTEDKQTIVNGMADDMVRDTEYFEILKKNFKHVVEFWNAGNFKGYIASDNKAVLDTFKENVGDLSSEFTDAKSKTATDEQNKQAATAAEQRAATTGTGSTETGTDTSQSENVTGDKKPEATIKNAAQTLADKTRTLKINSSIKDSMSKLSSTGVFEVAWDLSIEIAAKTIEAGGSVAQGVNDAIQSLKGSDWYKNLSTDGKKEADKIMQDRLIEELTNEDTPSEFNIRKLMAGVPVLSYLDNVWYDKVVRKTEDAVAKFVANAAVHNNKLVRGAAQVSISWFNGLPRTENQLFERRKLTGSQEEAFIVGQQMTKALQGMVNFDKESAERVHRVLDQEIYEEGDRLGYDDLTTEEKDLHDALKKVNEETHELNYQNGFISEETYEKFKGKYIARAYEEFEQIYADGEGEKDIFVDTSFFGKIYKERKEIDQWKIDNKIKDPIYLTINRMIRTQRNIAIKNYADYLITSGVAIDSPKEGYVEMKGARFTTLNGKYLPYHASEDFTGYLFTNKYMDKIYDGVKGYDKLKARQFLKKYHTTWSPLVQVGNFMSNHAFAFCTGINVLELWGALPAANKSIKNQDEDYKYLVRNGIVSSSLVQSDLVSYGGSKQGSLTFADEKKKMSVGGTLAKADAIASKLYSGSDDIMKISAFKALVKSGYSRKEAVEKVYSGFQNYATVGKVWDLASKTPIVGNAYIKFQADLMRIMKNAAIKRPLSTAAFMASLKLVTLALSIQSGEDDDEREIREGRAFIPKVNLGFMKIPLVAKVGGKEINLARFVAPYYDYDTPNKDWIESTTRFMPFQLQVVQDAELGQESISLEAPDVLLGGLTQAFVQNRDFRNKSVSDPYATRFKESGLTNAEKVANKLNYVSRSVVPLFSTAQDAYLSAMYGEDFYGRTKGTSDIFLSKIMKVQTYGKEELKKTVQGNIRSIDFEAKIINNKLSSVQKKFDRDLGELDKRVSDGLLSEEKASRKAESITKEYEERYNKYLDDLVKKQEEINTLIDKAEKVEGLELLFKPFQGNNN